MPDTVTIDGKEVPITELAAAYTKKTQLESEVATLQRAQQAAKEELARSAQAVQAIEKARIDPQFARTLADSLAELHSESAFFAEQTPPPAPEGSPVTPPAPGTPPTPPAAPVVDLAQAQQVEILTRQVQAMESQRMLDAKMASIAETYPAIDTDALLQKAIEQKLPLEHLDLLASDFERERLSGVLKAKDQQNSILDGLLAGGGSDDADEALAGIGSTLSSAQVNGDAEIDYSALSVRDSVALAMAKHGQPAPI